VELIAYLDDSACSIPNPERDKETAAVVMKRNSKYEKFAGFLSWYFLEINRKKQKMKVMPAKIPKREPAKAKK
jgi:hypothetical protein